jgi:hypothetical protein
MKKICVTCGVEKLLSEFEKQKDRPNHRKHCKKCRYEKRDKEKERIRHREYMVERRIKDPDALRMNWERSRYGVCKEDIGIKHCMICGSTNRLCIDHDHASGRVRGILCSQCNFGLGSFRDNPIFLELAIKYLIGN